MSEDKDMDGKKVVAGRSSKRSSCLKRIKPYDEEGVSDVVGNILTLVITVVIFSSIFAGVTQLEGPEDPIRFKFDTEYEYNPGTDYINITHIGGNSLEMADLTFIVFVDELDHVIPEENMTKTGADSEWTIGDEVRIELGEDELNIGFESTVELMIRDDKDSRIIYNTILLEEGREVLDIRNPRIDYKYIWRDHAEPGEGFTIKTDVVAPVYLRREGFDYDDLTVKARIVAVEETVIYDVDQGEEVEEVELVHDINGEFYSENLEVLDDADYDRYSLRITARYVDEDLDLDIEEKDYIFLNVGEPAATRYRHDILIGDVDYMPGSPSHNQEFRIEIEVYNRGRYNYTAGWNVTDNGEVKYEDETEFEAGPAPTVVVAQYRIQGIDHHDIDVMLNTTLRYESEGEEIEVEDVNPENNRKRFSVIVDPNVLVVRDRTATQNDELELVTNSLLGLNFDYSVHDVGEGYDFPENLDDHSICIWLTGDEFEEDELEPLLTEDASQEELKDYIENHGRLWLMGSNLGEIYLYFDIGLEDVLGIDNIISDPDINLEGELESDDEDGTYGDYTYPVYHDYKANEIEPTDDGVNHELYDPEEGNVVGLGHSSDDGENRTAVNTFLFESISDPAARANMTQEVILWLANLTMRTGTDISVSSQLIEPMNPMYMDDITIKSTLRNNGPSDLTVTVGILRNGILMETADNPRYVDIPKNGGTNTTTFTWQAHELGTQEFLVVADYYEEIPEVNVDNNDIRYKNLDVTEDAVEVDVQYSTLVVDADLSEEVTQYDTNITEYITDSLNRLGHEKGETYDYHHVDLNEDGPDVEEMMEYNAIIWVTGDRGDSTPLDSVFTEDDVGNLLTYFEGTESNVMFIGENILGYLNEALEGETDIDVDEAEELLQYMGIAPDNLLPEEASPTHLIGNEDTVLGRTLRYRLEDAEDLGTFTDTSEHGEVLFRDGIDNFASVYDDGSLKNIFLGVNPNRISGPLSTGEDFQDWPGGSVDISPESAIDELFYTSLWYLGFEDERTELRVSEYDIELSDPHPETGRSYEVTVEIENYGYRPASTMVRLKEGEDQIGTRTLLVEGSIRESTDGSSYYQVEPGRATAEYTWEPVFSGRRPIRVKVDPLGLVDEIEPYGEEGTEDKIMEFNNQAVLRHPVYYFYDDMERGPNKWNHDATLMNIDGTSPLDFIGLDGVDNHTNVEGDWDWSLSGSTDDKNIRYHGEGEGVYETTDPVINQFTGNASYSPPRSYWLAEGPGDPEGIDRAPLDLVLIVDNGQSMDDKLEDAKDAAIAAVNILVEGDRVAVLTNGEGGSPPSNILDGFTDEGIFVEIGVDADIDDIEPEIEGIGHGAEQKNLFSALSRALYNLQEYGREDEEAVEGIISLTDGFSNQDGRTGDEYQYSPGGNDEPEQEGPLRFFDDGDGEGQLEIPYNILTITITETIEPRKHWVSATSTGENSYGILERDSDRLVDIYELYVSQLEQSAKGELRSIPGAEPLMGEGQRTFSSEPAIQDTEFLVFSDAFTTGKLDPEDEWQDPNLPGAGVPGYGHYDTFEFEYVEERTNKGGHTQPVDWIYVESENHGDTISNTVDPKNTLERLDGEYVVKDAYVNFLLETEDDASIELRVNGQIIDSGIEGQTGPPGDRGEFINYSIGDRIYSDEPFSFEITHDGSDGDRVLLDDLTFTYEIDFYPEDHEYDIEVGTNRTYRYMTTPSVDLGDIEEVNSASLEFQQKYSLTEGTSGGFIYLWGKEEGEEWTWEKDNRVYVEPEQSYTGNLNIDRIDRHNEEGGPRITGDETENYLEDVEGNLPYWVFNGKSADRTFDWSYRSVDVGQYLDIIAENEFDEIRAVFVLAQFGGITREDGWEPEMGWYLDNVRFKVSYEWSSDGPGYWALTNATGLNETMGIDIDPESDERYHDHTLGNEDGHYWVFTTVNEDGEDRLPEGVDSSLYTRPIYLDNAVNPLLTAHMKFNIHDGAGLPPSGFRVEISADDGRSWNSLTYGVRAAWNESGSDCDYSGDAPGEDYGWVEGNSLARLETDLSGWRGERVILRFRVFTNTTEKYANYDVPRAIFIDDVWVTEGDMEIGDETSSPLLEDHLEVSDDVSSDMTYTDTCIEPDSLSYEKAREEGAYPSRTSIGEIRIPGIKDIVGADLNSHIALNLAAKDGVLSVPKLQVIPRI